MAGSGGDATYRHPSESTGSARYFLLSELTDRRIVLPSGESIGKLDDLVFRDDPKFAEVTDLVVRRPFGRTPLEVPWAKVERIEPESLVVRDPGAGGYPEFVPSSGRLLLRDQVLDKRILDTKGYALDVVYDLQLVAAGIQLFVVAADVSRAARRRRSALFRLGPNRSGREGPEERIPWRFVQPIGPEMTSTRGDVRLTVPKETLAEIRPEDLADILEELSREQRLTVFNDLSTESAAAALEETEPRVQREILHDADLERVERIFAHLSPVALAEILSALPREQALELHRLLKGDVAAKVRDLIEQHEVPASTVALSRFLAFPGHLTVAEAFERFREEAPRSDVTMYLYVVDPDHRLQGVVDINELLQADPTQHLSELMTRAVVSAPPDAELASVLELFRRYRFRALPLVDRSGRMVGVVREKDAFAREPGTEFAGRVM